MKPILTLKIAPIILSSISFWTASSVAHPHSHSTVTTPSVLLQGYPWGVFAVQEKFKGRAEHQLNDQELTLSNLIFDFLMTPDDGLIQLAMPINLNHQGYRPFGDGQSNGHAQLPLWWNDLYPPFIAVLKTDEANRSKAKLEIYLHSKIGSGKNMLEYNWKDKIIHSAVIQNQKTWFNTWYSDPQSHKNEKLKASVEIEINLQELGWSTFDQGKPLFIRPQGWNDWFVLSFQNPYVENDLLTKTMNPKWKSFQLGSQPSRSVLNPLSIRAAEEVPPLLQLQNQSKAEYQIYAIDKVHAEYPLPAPDTLALKSAGGNWTFELNPSLWKGAQTQTFKQLYSCFSGRALFEESMQKSVSGTGWHHVGDFGEVLVNSIENESRSLVTAIGVTNNENPPNHQLAYGFSHRAYAGFLRPGHAFITVQEQFHWHPVHSFDPICIEVWTARCKPNQQNGLGFHCGQ